MAKKPKKELLPRGAQLEPFVYSLGVQFHPKIKLDKRSGYEFATSVAGTVEPDTVAIQSHRWDYIQPLTGGGELRLSVEPTKLQLVLNEPRSLTQQWFEDRFSAVIAEFGKKYHPSVMLGSAAMVRALLTIEGDAREFISNNVVSLDTQRLAPFGRPVHGLGLRLVFPAYEKPTTGKRPAQICDWSLDLKIESLLADIRRVFIEADARWVPAVEWDKKAQEQAVEHLSEVFQFVSENVIKFLRQPPQHPPRTIESN